MPSELFGTSVIFVKVAPGYVERTLTTLRAKPNVTKTDGHASNAYLLIRSTDTQKTMSALKNVPEIQEIIGTTGDSDIVARISADPRENLLESVVTKVQGMPGVLSTETLPAFSKY